MMMNLVAGVFVAFVVTAAIAAQTEPCTLKQENEQVLSVWPPTAGDLTQHCTRSDCSPREGHLMK
jgi:hypothetical protein